MDMLGHRVGGLLGPRDMGPLVNNLGTPLDPRFTGAHIRVARQGGYLEVSKARGLPEGWHGMRLMAKYLVPQPNGDLWKAEVRRCDASGLTLRALFPVPLQTALVETRKSA